MKETYESLLAAVTSDTGIEVENPATGEIIGKAYSYSAAELEKVIDKAEAAQKEWAKKSDQERCDILIQAADAIAESGEALAQLVAHEQGKAVNPNALGAAFEVGAIDAWVRTAASLKLEPEVVLDAGGQKATLYYRPIGVVGGISPWNWPAMIATWQWAPALRMGNAIVLKPSSTTPLSVLGVAYLANKVLPEGLLQVTPGGAELRDAFPANPRFGRVTFTGSIETGAAIAKAAASNIVPVTLELGGNDAGIVLPDADPKAIIPGLFWGAFIGGGQTCAALKRLYVPENLYDEVVEGLAEFVKGIKVGPGTDPESMMGPLTLEKQRQIVVNLVEDAKARGARIVTGGDYDKEAPGYFYPLTLVADIENDARLVQEEQFGPALPIIKYKDVDEAVEMANAIDVGLGGSVWGPADEAREVAMRLETGSVWINQHGMVNPFAPFGGNKRSGYGSEFGVEGLKEMGVPMVIHDAPTAA